MKAFKKEIKDAITVADLKVIEKGVVKMASVAIDPKRNDEQKIKAISILKSRIVRKIVIEKAEMRVKSFSDKSEEESEKNILASANYIYSAFTRHRCKKITLKTIGDRATARMITIFNKFVEIYSDKIELHPIHPRKFPQKIIAKVDNKKICVNTLTIKVKNIIKKFKEIKPRQDTRPKPHKKPFAGPIYPIYEPEGNEYFVNK